MPIIAILTSRLGIAAIGIISILALLGIEETRIKSLKAEIAVYAADLKLTIEANKSSNETITDLEDAHKRSRESYEKRIKERDRKCARALETCNIKVPNEQPAKSGDPLLDRLNSSLYPVSSH